VESFFLKHGKISTFFGRLIPAVRQFISIPAGLARMRLPAFILFTTLGSAIWNSILVLLGYYLAQILPEDRLLEELERYSREISYVFVALVTLALITWYLKRKLKACR
jgi:membrane protein DedA with SNARE-associated domain